MPSAGSPPVMRRSTRPALPSIRSRRANCRPGGRNSSRAASTRCICRSRPAVRAARLADMACVVEAAAAALLPGPLLSTATASAVAGLADVSAAAADRRSGRRRDRGRRAARALRGAGRPPTEPAGGSTARPAHIGNPCSATYFVGCAQRRRRRTLVRAGRATRAGVGFACRAAAGHRPVHRRRRAASRRPRRRRATAVLSGIPTERARCVVVALAACAPAGTVRTAPTRRPTTSAPASSSADRSGAFQALQHKAAVLLVNAELAAAAAWDAVRGGRRIHRTAPARRRRRPL